MARVSEKYYLDEDDDDDWGMAGYAGYSRPQRHRGFPWRYRLPALALLIVISLLYWARRSKPDATFSPIQSSPIDWSRFAYVQYATDIHSMCNAFMVFETLHRLGSKADRVLLYPEDWNVTTEEGGGDRNGELLVLANDQFDVKLYPTQLLGVDGPIKPGTFEKPSTWESSITKLRAFELEEYQRVLYFDNDILLQQHMDELFLLPSAPIAMPRRYWADVGHWEWPLSGILMLIEPNTAEFKVIWDRLLEWRLVPERADDRSFDDDLLDDRFRSSALVLPHRPYILQTSEFRRRTHEEYMGTIGGPKSLPQWDPHVEAEKAKIIHFDDFPLPKPWIMWPVDGVVDIQPDCGGNHKGTCPDRDVWKGLYSEFRRRRKDVCKILSIPAPQSWKAYKQSVGVI